MALPRRVGWLVLALLSTAGCGGSGPPARTQAPVTEAIRARLYAGGGSVAFPSVAGYGATFRYAPNDAAAGVTAALATTVNPVLTYPAGNTPQGTVLAAFDFTLDRSVTFRGWNYLPTVVTLPPGLAVAGHTVEIVAFDTTTNVAIGINPGTVTGATVTFGAGLGPVTLTADTFECVLTVR